MSYVIFKEAIQKYKVMSAFPASKRAQMLKSAIVWLQRSDIGDIIEFRIFYDVFPKKEYKSTFGTVVNYGSLVYREERKYQDIQYIGWKNFFREWSIVDRRVLIEKTGCFI